MSKIDRIIELLESIESKLSHEKKTKVSRKKKTENEDKIDIWSAYSEEFIRRWKVAPERNAMINGMFANIQKRVSASDIEALVRFYVNQNDAFYLREMHHPRCLVKDCEILLTRMKSKMVITNSKAREIEKQAENANESARYLQNKYGV